MNPPTPLRLALLVLASGLSLQPLSAQQYVLVGWNDLGMHCANKDFSKIAVLPPYNNIIAQLVRKTPGQLPQPVTGGYTIGYSIPGNTYSAGKTNFWDYAQQLFGLAQPLPVNIGLGGKGLTGTMDTTGNRFRAVGIPVTPFADSDTVHENPYQLIHLVARSSTTGDTLATTDVVIPVSNEIGCVQSGCHASETAILNAHESVPGFNRNQPILCASCHASNALGTLGDPEARPLSYRIHNVHQFITPTNAVSTCYKCHPGPNTRCLRDVMGANPTNPLACQNCHGTMAQIASSINTGRRPWLDEPQCGNTACHGSNYAEEPGKLYRESKGHGGMFCSACHGSPHAIVPTVQANDNLQNIRLQGHAGPLRDCMVCHTTMPTGPGPHGIMATSTTVTVGVAPGWNMISNPVAAANDSVHALYPTAEFNYAYAYTGAYAQTFLMVNGQGYWEKFPASNSVAIAGSARTIDTIAVMAGWNMIGSTTNPVDTSAIVALPPGLRASAWYGYTGTYGIASQLIPGQAYWVKTNGPGQFVLSNPGLRLGHSIPASVGNPLGALNTVTISDSKGREQTLYFGVDAGNAIQAGLYELPPVPPAGAFDVRFETSGGGTMVQTHAATMPGPIEFPVTIQSNAYPLTVAWNVGGNASYEVTDGVGGEAFRTASMTGQGSVTISNRNVSRISIKFVSDGQLPKAFALAQNYPNPFNPSTTIRYDLPADARVSLRVFNIIGQEVATLVNEDQKAGYRSVEWNASRVASGVYFYRLQAGDFTSTRKLLLLK